MFSHTQQSRVFPADAAIFWFCLTLSLFVLGILTDNPDTSLSLDNFALFADGFH